MSRTTNNILRESIRQILLEKEFAIKVGDLKKSLDLAKKKKKMEDLKTAGKELAKKAGEAGVGMAIGAFPGGGTAWEIMQKAKDAKDLYKLATKGVPAEEKKQNPLWDFLTIDPSTSEIVDDKVEEDFIDAMSTAVEGLDDDQYLPNADDQLTNYLVKYHDGRYITGNEG